VEIATARHSVRRPAGVRMLAAVRTESGLFLLGAGVVSLHILDDNFVQPNPGTAASDHLASGLVPLGLLVGAAVFYGRLRSGARATIALLVGYFGVLAGTEALYYTRAVGPSGDDFTGLLSILAGLLLLGVGIATLWRSRRSDDRLWWRYGRRLVFAVATAVIAVAVLIPFSIGYVVTHVLRAEVPRAELGAAYEDVEFTTNDGLKLKGWYIPSKNGAAVISFPGRSGTQNEAKMLARHGYGVLLFDRRGEGASEGDPNSFGWQGERDIHAAVAFLQRRSDVDPERIGGLGLSVGGELMIEAGAESRGLKAIVSEGASGRSVRDILANPDGTWQEVLGNAVATAATALFTNNLPPADLRSLVPKIAPRPVFFVYGERGQSVEEPANRAFYADAGEPKAIWEVPEAGHVGGIDARPEEYERRVTAFFDDALLETQ
jgi:fermentation-respiration switch protein FrsA (DUF1100 family)